MLGPVGAALVSGTAEGTGGAPGAATGGVPGGGLGGVWGLCGDSVLQLTKLPTIASNIRIFVMTLLILEALGALLILVLIVWWTMFSGRPKGELRKDALNDDTDAAKK
jgi:hypothetical protein